MACRGDTPKEICLTDAMLETELVWQKQGLLALVPHVLRGGCFMVKHFVKSSLLVALALLLFAMPLSSAKAIDSIDMTEEVKLIKERKSDGCQRIAYGALLPHRLY